MKIVDFDSKNTIVRAVAKYATFITPTYGPAGKRILLANEFQVKSVDDGKMASQDFELENEHEQAIVKYIQEVTAKTDERVGDGTTTAAIIMSDIVKRVLTTENEFETGKNAHAEAMKLKEAVEEAVKQIKKVSKKISSQKELYEVAYNSYNNEEIAKLISETVFKVGKDGSISIEDSAGMTTDSEIVKGLEIERGFASPYFINKGNEAHLKSPFILLVGKKIEFFKDLVPFIKNMLDNGQKDFVVVAEGFSEEVIGHCVINKIKDTFHPLLVEIPGYGEDKREALIDLAIVTGGTVLDPQKGDKIEDVTPDKLGQASSITAKKDSTVVVGGKGSAKAIADRIEAIRGQITEGSKFSKEKLEKRIAKLLGGVAVIRVGAPTEQEQKTIKVKTEDAVNATKVALREGIVPGAGKTFAAIKTSSDVLNEALQAPRRVLEENGKQFLDDKVFDPTEVLVASLETAVSIACGLIETGAIVAEKRKKEDLEEQY